MRHNEVAEMKWPTATLGERGPSAHRKRGRGDLPNVSRIVVGWAPQSTVAVRALGLPGVDPVVVPEDE